MNQAERLAQGSEEGRALPGEEQLLFAMDEKSHEADMTEKGRTYVSRRSGRLRAAVLSTQLHDVGCGGKRMRASAWRRSRSCSGISRRRPRRPRHLAIAQAYSLYQLDVDTWCRTQGHHRGQETGPLIDGPPLERRLEPAVEAKEGVAIERETQTLATITIQNYFRLYTKLAGMTGTAETEAANFSTSTSSA